MHFAKKTTAAGTHGAKASVVKPFANALVVTSASPTCGALVAERYYKRKGSGFVEFAMSGIWKYFFRPVTRCLDLTNEGQDYPYLV